MRGRPYVVSERAIPRTLWALHLVSSCTWVPSPCSCHCTCRNRLTVQNVSHPHCCLGQLQRKLDTLCRFSHTRQRVKTISFSIEFRNASWTVTRGRGLQSQSPSVHGALWSMPESTRRSFTRLPNQFRSSPCVHQLVTFARGDCQLSLSFDAFLSIFRMTLTRLRTPISLKT